MGVVLLHHWTMLSVAGRPGGLIIKRHNKIRDAIGDIAALVWGRVLSEPVVKDASEYSDAGSDC